MITVMANGKGLLVGFVGNDGVTYRRVSDDYTLFVKEGVYLRLSREAKNQGYDDVLDVINAWDMHELLVERTGVIGRSVPMRLTAIDIAGLRDELR